MAQYDILMSFDIIQYNHHMKISNQHPNNQSKHEAITQGQIIDEESPSKLEQQNNEKRTINPTPSTENQHDEECKELMLVQPVTPISDPIDESCLSYGKNKVILRTSCLTIFIGPDYLCFIPTFLIFVLVSYLLINFIDRSVQNLPVKIITKIICIGQCLSYLLVAFSDPGIARPYKQQNKTGVVRTMFCRKCRFQVPSRTFHCSYCDVCIEGYDHHCPWTSKCIGKKNLVQFYIFLFMTPIFIVYCAFAFGFAAQNNVSGQPKLRVQPNP